jgi:coatomer subunit beta'
VLRFSREAYLEAFQNSTVEDDGVESAFEVVVDINETYISPTVKMVAVRY